jgi:hypothetical protein
MGRGQGDGTGSIVLHPVKVPCGGPPTTTTTTDGETNAPMGKMTIGETVDLIALHGETAYALETYGDRRGAHKSERDGYNLYAFALVDLNSWVESNVDTPLVRDTVEVELTQVSLAVGDSVEVFWTVAKKWYEAKITRLDRRRRWLVHARTPTHSLVHTTSNPKPYQDGTLPLHSR